MKTIQKNRRGFTLIEILIATVIFALSIIALTQTGITSLRSVIDSEMYFQAVQLAQSKMDEVESEFQIFIDKNGIKKGLSEKSEGKFEEPFEAFSWSATLTESALRINSDLVKKLLLSFGIEEDIVEEQVESQKLVIGNLNQNIRNNYAEVFLKIEWEKYGRKYNLPIVTHIIPSKPKIEFSATASADDEDSDAAPDSSEETSGP